MREYQTNSGFDKPAKITLIIERITTGIAKICPTIDGINRPISIPDTITKQIPTIVKGKMFLFKVKIPAVNPKAKEIIAKIPKIK